MPKRTPTTPPPAADGEPLRVLVIDDDRFHAETVAEVLEKVGDQVTVATSGKAGAAALDRDEFDVVLTDLRMADLDGLAIVRKSRQDQPEAEVVVMTGFGDVKTAVEAMKLGALHYLQKPLDMAEVRAIVQKAGERRRLSRANRDLRRQLDEKFGFEGVVGNSPKMHDAIARLKAYAPTRATVLILGESGTGKELAARALHFNSPRRAKPFVAMNCTALNENLLDDELFGHEPGAFTGADRLRKGRFEHATGGTLFLDEVGDMPLALQAKLLRVLENGEVYRVGSNDAVKVDVRLLSATNRDLETLIAEGKFRRDLYFRLKVGTVMLPPLRDRREDIPLLTAHFLKEFNARHGKQVTGIAEPLRQAFDRYDWPGNVRELRNAIESAVVQDADGVLALNDLPESDPLRSLGDGERGRVTAPSGDALVGRPLAEVERYYIERALERTGGNREAAAELLGIGERTLYRVIQDWKQQDRIRAALDAADWNFAAAGTALGITPTTLERKVKKWGWRKP
ncbi:MAG TPA: sigma-54 dependent transcriptional regulator [Gemmataceae bacterium]|jgi:two-component system response regulator HydG